MAFFWIKEGSNFVAIKYTKPAAEKVEAAFNSPSDSNIDNDLVEYFRNSVVGDAIEINLKESGKKTDRSLKVTVGKHAALANRKLDYRNTTDGTVLFRVSEIVTPPTSNSANGSANGEASTEANVNVEALTQEPTTGETTGRRR